MCAVLLFLQALPLSQGVTPLKNWKCQTSLLSSVQVHGGSNVHSTPVIPNLVHFVYLVENPSEPDISFGIRRFISIYSASYYLRPEAIYIHTNLDQSVIDNIWEAGREDPYVKAISQIPNVKFNRHLAPKTTTTNKTIDKLPNQSDFVRTDVLKKYGGIYLDDDAYVLRDLRPFREMGFEMVTGRQRGGQICPAVILTTPENNFISAYHALQDRIFDGGWATHAVDLLTALVFDFAETDHRSLIVSEETFFPGSWMKGDLQMIYQQHDESDKDYDHEKAIVNPPTSNLTDFIENFKLDHKLAGGGGAEREHTWKHDWSLSYVLHGWTSGIKGALNEQEKKDLFGKHEKQNLAYVLSRRSNFARAVYPAVRHALDTGILSVHQEAKTLSESPMTNGTKFASKLHDEAKQKDDSKKKEKEHIVR